MTLSHCGEAVRKHDPDRFLLSMFAPPAARESLWALYAFNHEIARTREVVTDTQLGLIRLQWWREALEKRNVAGSPVLDGLYTAMDSYGLPREDLERLIYAREFDLEDRQPANMQGLLNYADFTSTPLLSLSCRVAGEDAAEDALRPAAVAYALTGILRALPAHLKQRRCLVPADMVPSAEGLYAGKDLERLKLVAEEIAMEAEKRVLEVKGRGLAALHARLAGMYLSQIARAGYDLFSPTLSVPPLARGMRLWWGNLRATG